MEVGAGGAGASSCFRLLPLLLQYIKADLFHLGWFSMSCSNTWQLTSLQLSPAPDRGLLHSGSLFSTSRDCHSPDKISMLYMPEERCCGAAPSVLKKPLTRPATLVFVFWWHKGFWRVCAGIPRPKGCQCTGAVYLKTHLPEKYLLASEAGFLQPLCIYEMRFHKNVIFVT